MARHLMNRCETAIDPAMQRAARPLSIGMRNISKPVVIAGGVAVSIVLAVLAFGVFGVHTLFIDEEVNDANPFETALVGSEEASDDPASARPTTTIEAPGSDLQDVESTPAPAAPEVVTVTAGVFVDGDHPTSGTAATITDGTLTFLRFEDFATDNGPDLNVYLRASADPDDVVDLGDLRGNIGDQNYELPADIDLGRYDVVDIWCVRFGVSFGSAALSP
jgi:hypothetical protein